MTQIAQWMRGKSKQQQQRENKKKKHDNKKVQTIKIFQDSNFISTELQ